MDESCNYYAAPEEYEPMPRTQSALPGFVKGWCIADLVFCSFRAIFVLLGILVLAASFNRLSLPGSFFVAFLLEILTGLGICIFGFSGNILLLLRKPAAIGLCWVNAVCTAGSILIAVWESWFQISQQTLDGPTAAGQLVGVGIALIIRVSLLVFYCMAIMRAKDYLPSKNPFAPEGANPWR